MCELIVAPKELLLRDSCPKKNGRASLFWRLFLLMQQPPGLASPEGPPAQATEGRRSQKGSLLTTGPKGRSLCHPLTLGTPPFLIPR